jgi:hypothetical protein
VSLHEDFNRKEEGEGSSDRGFGIVFAIFFALVGLAPLRTHHPVRWVALAIGGGLLIVALVRPVWLHYPNRAWRKLGLLMGRVVSPVVTALLFFLVVTPMGFLMRLTGKDPLRLRSEPGVPSYWIERRPPGPAPQTMSSQF